MSCTLNHSFLRNVFPFLGLALCAFVVPVGASAAEEPRPRIVSVTGQGEVQAEPDQAIVTLGVERAERLSQDAAGACAAPASRVRLMTPSIAGLLLERDVNAADYGTERADLKGRADLKVGPYVRDPHMLSSDFVHIRGVLIEDTFAEAFGMRGARIVITARTRKWAHESALKLTGFATSVIACKCEAAIERELSEEETPDGRPGVSVLFFTMDGGALRSYSPASTSVGTAMLPRLPRRSKVTMHSSARR